MNLGIATEYVRVPIGTKFVFHRNDAFQTETGRDVANNAHENRLSSHLSSHHETISETKNEIVRLNRDEKLIVNVLVSNPNVTYEDISAATGFSGAKTGRLIQALRDAGAIERIGSRKNGTWNVVMLDD